ncbi:MAG: SDR family oxidoreductase, partial [Symploca sp. SIO2D2]|nr:SDR family oxidoreductase [Symploca sp. SIO2D2]
QDLQGKIAVVTGGAGVLCSVVAEALANSGCRVAICDLDGEKASERAAAISQSIEMDCRGYACDVLAKDSLEETAKSIERELGPVSLLVNGAGGNGAKATTHLEQVEVEKGDFAGSFFGLGEEGFKSVMDLNLLGTVLPSQVWGYGMTERGEGSIVNITSMNAYRPLTRIPAYAAAKCAVKNFTEWLATHLAPSKVRVNAVAPGFFLTEQLKYLAYDKEGVLTQRYEKVLANTPMGRFGEPEELVGAFLYLLSDQSSFVTGATLPVDGGFSCFSGV